jgi:hypothetical protein
VGHGALQSALPSLLHDGWDDVPTLKLMSSQDMEAHNLTPQQRVTLTLIFLSHRETLTLIFLSQGKTLALSNCKRP